MNDSKNVEQSRVVESKRWWIVALTLASGLAGCRGTAPSLGQAFSGWNSPNRVPPPATGSFQVPGSYSGTQGSSSGLGTSSFSNTNKTSQTTPPSSGLLATIANAQSQIRSVTEGARSRVNQTADGINTTVDQAGARVDRFGEGVVQASAILSEAARPPADLPKNEDWSAPIVEMPSGSSSSGASSGPSSAGRIGDSNLGSDASWRAPVKR